MTLDFGRLGQSATRRVPIGVGLEPGVDDHDMAVGRCDLNPRNQQDVSWARLADKRRAERVRTLIGGSWGVILPGRSARTQKNNEVPRIFGRLRVKIDPG